MSFSKKYRTADPYFPKEEIRNILRDYKNILEGNGFLSMGKNVINFEKEFTKYIGCKFSNVTASCTGALELTLKALNISYNDEVIVPCQTFFATASAVIRNNAIPVFCNVDKNFSIDFQNLKSLVTRKTKAIIVVHFAGLIQENIFEIKKFCVRNNLFLIEDCAHALGSSINNIKAGNIGDAGCFSFYSTKNLTTGEGGMITSNSLRFSNLVRSLKLRGIKINTSKEIFVNVGTNQRLTEFQAILGLHQLKRIKSIIKKRNILAKRYDFNFRKIKKLELLDSNIKYNNINSYWRYILRFKKKINRNSLKKILKTNGIDIDWPYFPLLHKQPILKKFYKKNYLNTSELYASKFICLPMHNNLSLQDIDFISKKLIYILKKNY